MVVCTQCVDRTAVCPPPEGVCGGGCGSTRTDTLTADGSRGCRPCAGEMPVHTVWLARAVRQLPLALAWVAQSLPEAVPALLPSEKMALCVEMADQWRAAATAALPPSHGTSTAAPAFPGNPTPWSSWWTPTRRALQLSPSAGDPLPRWPQCVGGAPRQATRVLPALRLVPAPAALPPAAPPRPRPLRFVRVGGTRVKRGRGAGTDAPPAAERSVTSFFRPIPRPRSPAPRAEPRAPAASASPAREGLHRAGMRRSSPRGRRSRTSSSSSSSRSASSSSRSSVPRRPPQADGAADPRSFNGFFVSSDRPRVWVTGASYGRPVPDPD